MFYRIAHFAFSLATVLVLAACGGGDDECPAQPDIYVGPASDQCTEPTAAGRVRLPTKPPRGGSL